MQRKDYRNTHTAPDKGTTYDRSFQKSSYRTFIWSWEKKVLKDVINCYFQSDSNIRYLDFACGTGRIIGYLENLVGTSMGVDVSDSMLDVGRRKVKRSKLIKADLTHENIFAGETFDLITAFRFFLNAQPELREDVITILSSLLSDNGYLVFNIHMNEGSIADRMRSSYHWLRGHPRGSYHTLGRQSVFKMVQTAGLQIVATHHFGLLPIKGEKSRFPERIFNFIEGPASKISYLESLSKYVVYVCQKDHSKQGG